jgi:hypothetical protein
MLLKIYGINFCIELFSQILRLSHSPNRANEKEIYIFTINWIGNEAMLTVKRRIDMVVPAPVPHRGREVDDKLKLPRISWVRFEMESKIQIDENGNENLLGCTLDSQYLHQVVVRPLSPAVVACKHADLPANSLPSQVPRSMVRREARGALPYQRAASPPRRKRTKGGGADQRGCCSRLQTGARPLGAATLGAPQ